MTNDHTTTNMIPRSSIDPPAGNKWRILLLGAGILIFILLGVYSHYWLDVITGHVFGADFNIYWRAYQLALTGENPYFPYDIGGSFIYHPFALTFISILDILPGQTLVLWAWALFSIGAYVYSIQLLIPHTGNDLLDQKQAAKQSQLRNVFLFLLLLSFAPFWENIFIGQINTIVLLFVVLSFRDHLRGSGWKAGIWIALAAVLKTSPGLMVGYYLVKRGWKEVLGAFFTLVVLTLVSVIQFGFDVVLQFVRILPQISTEIHPTIYNQSSLAIAYRLLEQRNLGALDNHLVRGHKWLFLGLILAILAFAMFQKKRSKQTDWHYLALFTSIIIFSPLVWLHHSVFLVFPIIFLFGHNKFSRTIGIISLFLIQATRLFEANIVQVAYPVLLGHFLIMALLLYLIVFDRSASLEIASQGL